MLFVPYRAQIKLQKFPTITVLVMVICFFVYLAQYQREKSIEAHATRVCQQLAANSESGFEGKGFTIQHLGMSDTIFGCPEVMLRIYFTADHQKAIQRWQKMLRAYAMPAEADRLERQFKAFIVGAPRLLDENLWHDRTRVDFIGMLTSVFAHADWAHLIFNLIFFFVFAASVEMVIGPALFAIMILVLTYAIGIFDHGLATWRGDLRPSLGLSGVVMGMLGLYAYLLPKVKIRFFYWFMFSLGTIGLPAWMAMVWFMGWDLISQLQSRFHYVNYIAHLSGGAFGLGLGILLFRKKREWTRSLIVEDLDLTKDETILTKINDLSMAPVILGFAFLAMMYVLIFAILLVQNFWLQMMMVAPIVAAGAYLYWQKHKPDDYDRYRRGSRAIEEHQFEVALKCLKPLADRNYARALTAMGRLHLTAGGALKDPALAAGYLSRAAERGNAEAQYMLATLLVDGRGVPPSPHKAAEWYAKAAMAGMSEAALSLAHLYENGAGVTIDLPKAIEWYGRAGEGFQKAGRREDVMTVIRILDGLADRNPEASAWLNKFRSVQA